MNNKPIKVIHKKYFPLFSYLHLKKNNNPSKIIRYTFIVEFNALVTLLKTKIVK